MNYKRGDYLEKMEDIVLGKMSSKERADFENDLTNNPELNEFFLMYKTIDTEMRETGRYSAEEAAVRSTLNRLNLRFFSETSPVVSMHGNRRWYRIAMSAAAVLVLVLGAYFLLIQKQSNPQQLANLYVKEELSHLSLTMDGGRDSLQQGIAAYNNKEYTSALEIFNAVYKAHPGNSDALKYEGITYLVTGDYERALTCFGELTAKKELFSNPGVFLQAVVLLSRNEGNDQVEAKRLLQQVIDEKLEGNAEASNWLK